MSLLSTLFSGDILSFLIMLLSRTMVVFFCLPVHEFSHAFVASRLGDPTPRAQGRLTLNPMAHLSPMGTLMIFLVGIGFAKPVQVNMQNFKKPRQGMALVALAGPVSNLIMSFLSVFCYYFIVFLYYQGAMSYDLAQALSLFFGYVASVNIWLAIFNLIPIPPLDGSRILNLVLPARTYYKLMEYEQYIMIGLLIVLFTGVLNAPIGWLADKFFDLFAILPRFIFGLQ